MIGQTISHYKILEKPPNSSGQVGEVRKFLPQFLGGTGIFRIPPVCGGILLASTYLVAILYFLWQLATAQLLSLHDFSRQCDRKG